MKVRIRHSSNDKDIEDVPFINWFYDTSNKEDYTVIDWGELVYWQLIDKNGIKSDHRIIAKDHALRILKSNKKNNAIRDLHYEDWAELRNKFYDSPSLSSRIKEKKEIELRSIERELLRYIYKSGDNVKSTKTFADAKEFSVSTINDVAKSLKDKYLITTEAKAGLDPKTQMSYISFRCELTSLGNDLSKKVNKSLQDYSDANSSLSRYRRIKLKTNKGLTILEKHPVVRVIVIIGSIASILALLYYFVDKIG